MKRDSLLQRLLTFDEFDDIWLGAVLLLGTAIAFAAGAGTAIAFVFGALVGNRVWAGWMRE